MAPSKIWRGNRCLQVRSTGVTGQVTGGDAGRTRIPPNRKHKATDTSIFDLLKVGIGPSSSHTVGPMVACNEFTSKNREKIEEMSNNDIRVVVHLYGSLSLTGPGHSTDVAVFLGLAGMHPSTVDLDQVPDILKEISNNKRINLGATQIAFNPKQDIVWNLASLPLHANGMKVVLHNKSTDEVVAQETYYSIGGGFIATEKELKEGCFNSQHSSCNGDIPFPFSSALELLRLCHDNHMTIADIMRMNEVENLTREEVSERLSMLWKVMKTCVARGCLASDKILPGPLKVKRRAPKLFESVIGKELLDRIKEDEDDPVAIFDKAFAAKTNYSDAGRMCLLSTFAIAVNEENAAGGKVVTAPTNGASGIIPATMCYLEQFVVDRNDKSWYENFLLTASAVGLLFKHNASISGAEAGCQGEVGVASSMAAAGFTAIIGGNVEQVENAAEIAMEHHIGLTCDPVAGQVQLPCIERNAMGATKAMNASILAICGDGNQVVSLDEIICVMKETGNDMSTYYKETSKGGLAKVIGERGDVSHIHVGIPEC